ncbi:MAG: MmcQ/YjbR family DNA-binding protein [Actinomycetota bacterium]|nr:MmcQ/YjbR family DNA-binding protein [Acidimicrobiia bacterium]MDQ3293163.1 MmcQ/YjbR family DNA-binding protein [Actinomycetota bacterium]
MSSVEDVRRIVEALPETSEKVSWGFPAWHVKKTFLTRIREEGVLVVHVSDEGEKFALIESEPDKFFTVAHYDGYPMVLVRLPAVDAGELEELLVESWRLKAPKRLLAAYDAEHPPPPG